ncbi:hypothetical protein ACTFIY_010834 [Dictyostelium cf. discoideum]
MKVIEIDISDNDDNSILFFKIWRNCVLKNLIFKYLIMFNLFSFSVDINSSQQQQFIKNNKQFLKSLFIKVDDIKKDEITEKLNNLPNYIESISLYQPSNISSISFNLCENLELPPVTELIFKVYNQPDIPFVSPTNNSSSIFSNLTILEFSSIFNQEIGVNILPMRMKHLELKVYNKNGNLLKSQEISNLLKLTYSNIDITSMIPPSVTNLTIFYNLFHGPFQAPPQQLSSQFSSLNLNATTPIFLLYWVYEKSSKLFLNKFQSIKSIKVNIIENDYKLDFHSQSCLKTLINLDLSEFLYKFFIKPVKDFKVFTNLKCLRIELGLEFKQPIHKKWLPISIKYIIILNDETPISINSLPNSLESIWISNKHYQLNNNCFKTILVSINW